MSKVLYPWDGGGTIALILLPPLAPRSCQGMAASGVKRVLSQALRWWELHGQPLEEDMVCAGRVIPWLHWPLGAWH